MIRATPREMADITAFLMRHADTSMFTLSNLARHGMDGDHARSMSVWVTRAGSAITDVLAMAREGSVFPQCPSGDWATVAAVLAGRQVKGFLGPADQVAALRKATGFPVAAGLDVVEPGYALPLADLRMPDTTGLRLVPLSDVSRALLNSWRADYAVEALGVPADDADAQALRDIDGYLAFDSHRALLQGDTPVAMTGFNAILPEMVQIGGVYTPPALRARGFGRAAVALHLAEARARGVRRAVLFAANAAAEQAYRAIGFHPAHRFAVALMDDAVTLHG